MTVRPYLQLDVFADRPGAGNPLAVVLDSRGLDDARMQAFATWVNLSETVFFLPPEHGADYRIRIFTPRQELPFAGHPSVGAAWAALDAGLAHADAGRLHQQCEAGVLPVRVTDSEGGRVIHVRAPRARRLAGMADSHSSQRLLHAALEGLPTTTMAPARWDNGPVWWTVQLSDAAAVRGAAPDLAAIAALTLATGAVGLAVFAAATEPGHDLVVRAFCPADGIPEDPVTGSANACIAAALAEGGALPGTGGRYVASQGREVGRDGQVQVEVDPDGEVWIGGHVQAVMRGQLDW